ncbi:tetratricopeptide repeat protein [Deinococcus aquiradiocola]|uniref:Tetratricopeptide repeat protein n=1 Tax=Deinococcus aquiradiocola TaxID=393059 RepID=A0A917PHL9_9DEIO|nr:tetratricopeptide repeat protein [Deinococcus aquiradiocola]GGJ78855.1 hypothetical protein GCM10008939_23400 [Deinococcus aquiradiocola]
MTRSSSDPVLPLYLDVYALTQAGAFQQALDLLDAATVRQPRHHHRQRGYALHNLYRYEEAHREMSDALTHCEGNARGSVFADWAVMYMREQRYEEGYTCYHQALALLTHPEARAQALYNLGWTHLRRGHPQHALQYLEEALTLIRRSRDADARWWLTFVRCGLALHARLTGNWTLALQRAAQAVREAEPGRAEVFALHTLASTQRLHGDLETAALTQARAVRHAGEGQATLTETLHDQLIALQRARHAGTPHDPRTLRDLIPSAAPYDAWRGRLYLAQHALDTGGPAEALVTLRAALDVQEPYVLLDEAPALKDLYTFGRSHGLDLPTATPPLDPHLHLTVRGAAALSLDGHRLPAEEVLPVGVLLYLHLEGPATPETLARALIDLGDDELNRGKNRVRAALKDLAYWTGSDEIVQRSGRTYLLHPAWTVTSDVATTGPGRVLAELYGPWTARFHTD